MNLLEDDLLNQSNNEFLKGGVIISTARKFHLNTQTVSEIEKTKPSNFSMKCSFQKIKLNRLKKKEYIINERIRNVPVNKRKNNRSLAGVLQISKTYLLEVYKCV